MIIRKLKLQNFGVHKNLDIDTQGKRIIGLLGKNGSGKSTILSAIKYAFTSEITGTIESNLRSGSKTGSVELEFLYNNETGSIKRTIGKSSKAELIWKGTRITVKKDIENALLEVLGVDKKSLSSAVFLSQGSLNNLLFGSDSDREELFIKVMNMSFCQKFAEVLDQKSKSILDGNDNITLIDELNRQRILLSERLDNYKQDLKKYPNCEQEIFTLEERSRLTAKLAENIGLLNQMSAQLNKYENEVKKLADTEINQELVTKVGKDARQAKETYNELEAHLESLRELDIINHQLEVYYEEIKEERDNIKVAQQAVAVFEKSIEEKGLKEKVAYHRGIVEVYESWLNDYDEAMDIEESVINCMTCGTEHEVSPEGRKKIQEKLLSANKELDKAASDLAEYMDNIQKLQDEINDKQSNVRILSNSIKENEVSKSKNQTGLNATLSNDISEVEKEFNLWDKKSHSLEEYHLELCSNWGQISGLRAKIEHTEDRIRSIMSENETVKSDIEKLQSSSKNIDDLRETDKTHKELKAKLDELAEQYAGVNDRYNTLMSENEEVELKKEVHKELQRLKEVFSRKGLPKAFVDSRFEVLTELTQKNLEELGTDFYITQSECKSLAFDYNINYDGEFVQLPMHKLSGGQRVRLSLAFILAVQQLIVSDLGFVTLDEPSTHLDEEGVDSLCNLLEKVRDVFADSEHQLWVCDHNPKLESSFDTIVKL